MGRLSFLLASVALSVPDKPHIVIMLADNVGWAVVEWHRPPALPAREISTPKLDALRASGLELDRHYTYKFCSPSRSALMSGRLPAHVNVYNDDRRWRRGAPAHMRLMPAMLRDAGYRTHFVGKWHLGMATNNYYDGTRAEGCGDAAHADLWDGDGPSHLNGTAYEELVFRDRVVDVVEAHDAARPLFIYYALHTSCVGYDPDGTAGGERDSLQPDRAYYDKFSFIDDDDRRANVAMVALMDDVAGDVVGALRTAGLWSTTLLYGHAAGENATRDGGDACYFSKPYKLLVGSVRQNGWPGQIHPNTSVAWDSFADVLDCAAGCLFDVVADPEERRDLAAAMPDTVAELRARLERAAFYDPDRGDPDPRACAVAAATGYWGPFLP
ncbi:sulfuric ester hydrolase [Aureococcus anophagefferens]|nr:sulfuric ester hydrolase [Aureococcus anophagefferens]